jgi:hypothetical protein
MIVVKNGVEYLLSVSFAIINALRSNICEEVASILDMKLLPCCEYCGSTTNEVGTDISGNHPIEWVQQVASILREYEHIKLDTYNLKISYHGHIRKCRLVTVLCRQFKVTVRSSRTA